MALKSGLIAGFIILFAAVVFLTPYFISMPAANITHVKIGSTTVEVEVADTEASRELGLSFRDSLLPGHGMLFVFDEEGNHGFWMKDTHIPLDIIFADKQNKIITIHRNVTPGSYRKNPPQLFYPTSPALYVLEVPAGFAQEQGIAEGMYFVLK